MNRLSSPSFASCPLFAPEQLLELETPTGVIKGTLASPLGVSSPPVVLIVAGSGPTDRDGNTALISGKNDSLKLLAAALRNNGIASVRYDKRGVAASANAARDESDLRIEDYVQDAASWPIKLAHDTRFSGVTILGHSEGALIGLLAAQRSPATAFISIASPAGKAAEVLRRQLRGRLPPDLAARSDTILASLEAGHTVSDVPAPLMILYRPSVQPYLISWFKYAPTDEVAKLRVPCLILQGETDSQVSVADAEKLHAANKQSELRVISGMNHIMKMVVADSDQQIASYADPTRPLAGELTQALTQFFAGERMRAAIDTQR